MPETEEELRQYLRAAVQKERQAIAEVRARRSLGFPLFGLLGGLDQGLMRLDIAARDLGEREAARTAVPVTLDQPATAPAPTPVAPAPTITQMAAAPAPGGRLAHELARALAVFGAVIAIGAGVVFGARNPGDLKIWLAVAVGLVACALLYIGAHRSLAETRHDPGNPPLVS
jgi:hypothetical protein